eukprot:COSAG02_NODE_21288_length_794_cov_1.835971_1_plen_89_part_01
MLNRITGSTGIRGLVCWLEDHTGTFLHVATYRGGSPACSRAARLRFCSLNAFPHGVHTGFLSVGKVQKFRITGRAAVHIQNSILVSAQV